MPGLYVEKTELNLASIAVNWNMKLEKEEKFF